MELAFETNTCSCLDRCLLEVHNAEETLEIRIPEGQPDVGRVLAAWGQPVIRGKEWDGARIGAACGLMIRVLYMPEDGSRECCLEGWIPYPLRWDIPAETPEGKIRLGLRTRFVDARTTGPRKIMVRSGLSVLVEAYCPREVELFVPGDLPEPVQLLKRRYPVRILKEAGEKAFLLTEELMLPPSAPQPESLLAYSLQPEVTDQKVIANKVVFRGNGNLHLAYRSEEGQLHTWDFPLAFSQFGELEETRGGDARADTRVCVTNLELTLDDEGHLQLRAALTGQYLVDETVIQELAVDAYCPGRLLRCQSQTLQLPVILSDEQSVVSGQRTLAAKANMTVEAELMTGYPLPQNRGSGRTLVFTHNLQLLYYSEEGTLESACTKWESTLPLPGENGDLRVHLNRWPEPRILPGSDSLDVQWEVPMQIVAMGSAQIPMIRQLELGDPQQKEDIPSLIVRRAGQDDLWQIAKETGSTMEAIRQANGLQEAPQPGQLLLIPLGIQG